MAIIPQLSLFGWEQIEKLEDLERLRLVLEYMPDEEFMQKLENERGNGRDDYPVRAMWNGTLAGIVFQHISAASMLRELGRNGQLRWMCGFRGKKQVPTEDAYTRFLQKLLDNEEYIDQMFDELVEKITATLPDFGQYLAMDSKAIDSLSKHNNKKKEKDGRRDTDADYGKKTYRGLREDGTKWEKVKVWFGYKLHLVVDSKYEIPVGYAVTKASASDITEGHKLIDKVSGKHPEILSKDRTKPGRCEELSADKGYDDTKIFEKLWDEYCVKPVIDIRNSWGDGEATKQLDGYENVSYDIKGNAYCYDDHGHRRLMVNGGFDQGRNSLKKLCPAKEKGLKCNRCEQCRVKSGLRIKLEVDRRIFTPIDRSSYKWKRSYARRTAVERVNSRLDVSFGFENHYIRGMAKMALRCSLALTVMLAMAYGRIQEGRIESIRRLVSA